MHQSKTGTKRSVTVTPMGKLFESPLELLDKAKREKKRLTDALEQNNVEQICDSVFNFAVTAYHIKDWLSEHHPELQSILSQAIKDSDALSACRDLCNGSKHAKLDLERWSNKATPPITVDLGVSLTAVTASAMPNAGLTSLIGTLPPGEWSLKIQLENGRRLAVINLAEEAIRDWDSFFERHQLVR